MKPLVHENDPLVEVSIGTYKNTVRQAKLFCDAPLKLEHGATLSPINVAYETWGTLNDARDNAVLLIHALTGDSHAASHGDKDRKGWFEEILAPGGAFDPGEYCVVCSNWLGSNYGTTGPTAISPETGQPFGSDFPIITVDDMSRVQKSLADHLGIGKWRAVVGGSIGGMIALDYAARFPGSLVAAIPIATGFRASPWVIAFHEIMRCILSIGNDSGDEELLRRSLEVARMLGIVTYRNRREFMVRYQRTRAELDWQDKGCSFAVESYLRHQGSKLDERFDATTYDYLTRAADRFDLGETHGSLEHALARMRCRVLAIGVDSDYLFPLEEQREIVEEINAGGGKAELGIVESEHGHDGFLIEFDQLNSIINSFLKTF
ncbi:MAG: homoserine O-acetyltransferase [Proteobacteria bacterium]|nr:homoserine O-acetyltransferase [Pseudomonadota bacterium]